MMKTARSLAFLVLCTLTLSSCGTAFNREWSAAMAKPIPVGSIEGPWEGTWLSQGSGHHGSLRCVVGPQTGHDRPFFYHATWGSFLSGSFKAQHHVSTLPTATAFTADSDLGVYGKFKANGIVTNGDFKATYNAAGDHGTFEMKRPLGGGSKP